MSALTDYSKWDAIDDSSDAESDAAQQSAPKEDPVLTGAKNVVCQLRAKLSLLPEGTLDEGWTSPPLPGGASKRELFTATCLRLEFPGIFSNEEEARARRDNSARKSRGNLLRRRTTSRRWRATSTPSSGRGHGNKHRSTPSRKRTCGTCG